MLNRAVAIVLLASVGLPAAEMVVWPLPALSDEAELPGPDTQFIAKAITSGQDEVEVSRLAVGQAVSPDVKQFAQHLVTDHTELNKKLSAAAQKNKLKPEGTYGTPPLEVSAAAQQAKERLAKLSGQQFDLAYLQQMVHDHETAVAQFQEEAKNGKDTATRELAAGSLPILREHLKTAQEMLGRMSHA